MSDADVRHIRIELQRTTLGSRVRALDLAFGFGALTIRGLDRLGSPIRSQLLAIDAIDVPALIAALRALDVG